MPTLVQRPSTGSTTAASFKKRRATPWWHILVAFLFAFLLLAASIVLLAWALPHWPRPPLRKGAAPITLTIQPSEPAETPGLHKTEVVPPQQQPEYMRTNDEQKAATPPPDPAYISDKDTHAAAEKPADDPFKPLPTQDGKEIAAFDFLTNPYIAGPEAHDVNSAAAPAVTQPASTPPPPDAEASPTPRPVTAKPTPTPGEFLVEKSDATPSDTPPEPSPSPTPKSSSTPPVRDLLAQQAARVRQESPSVNSRSIQQPPGYQPQSVQTKMSGSVRDPGKSSVSALGTPLGRYEKAISDAISARWYQLVSDRMSDLVQTENVQIHFYITRTGKTVSIRANGPKKDTVLASISIQAITESELPPIPDNVASTLPESQLEVDFTFGLFE